MSANRYLPAALNIARAFPAILATQGLKPLVSRFVLTETERGDAWLFVVMEDGIRDFLDFYNSARVLTNLSSALQGHPVLFGETKGLRYAILLSPTNN